MHLPPKVQKWVDALRSGEFKQGKSALRNGSDRYCCLGVLTELYRRENPELLTWEKITHNNVYTAVVEGGRDSAYLQSEIRNWLGGITPRAMYDLAASNDEGMPFDMIASKIEALTKSGVIGQDASS